ncbi:Gp37-like protein [Arthrobacter sp. CP30]
MKITVYDKDRQFAAQVGAPLELTITPRVFPLIGTARMVLPLQVTGTDADRMVHADVVAALRAPSARVVFDDGDPEAVFSGVVDEATETSDGDTLEVLVLSDDSLIGAILGWQVPTAGASGYTIDQSASEYRSYTGKAETVVKNAVRENGVTRLQVPGLVVAPDLGRGAVIPGGATLRMHPLPDRIFPSVTNAGIGLRIRQVGSQLMFDVYVPRVYPYELSVKAGTLKAYKHTRRRPTITRVVVGGPGEGKARRYRRLVDAAAETTWGFCGEGFVDARDTKDDTEPEDVAKTIATMDARGWEALREAGKVDTLSITLAETTAFRYGTDGVLVGDIVPVRTPAGVINQPVTEAVRTVVAPNVIVSEPVIGERVDSAAETQKNLAAVKVSQRKEERA